MTDLVEVARVFGFTLILGLERCKCRTSKRALLSDVYVQRVDTNTSERGEEGLTLRLSQRLRLRRHNYGKGSGLTNGLAGCRDINSGFKERPMDAETGRKSTNMSPLSFLWDDSSSGRDSNQSRKPPRVTLRGEIFHLKLLL